MWCRSIALALSLLPWPAAATETYQTCGSGQIAVITDNPDAADSVCEMSRHGLATLGRCGITLDRLITIRLLDTLSPGCLGIYHCGDDSIDLLEHDAMSAARSATASLAHVEDDIYFRSILTHELAHAAYDKVKCPFENCIATAEYLANSFQLMSLPGEDLDIFESRLDMATPVSRDSLNVMMYFMAPDKHLKLTWIHLNQRDDACTFLNYIMEGNLFFDSAHP